MGADPEEHGNMGKSSRLIEVMHCNVLSESSQPPCYKAVYPPSTGSIAPVIKEDSSLARKRQAWAMSSG